MPTLLVENGLLVTQDPGRRILRGSVRIEDGVITHVGEAPRARADEVLDASNAVVMPGLVNAHTHLAMTLMRGLGDDLPLEEWLRSRIWPAEAGLTEEDVAHGTRLALLELLRGGTTSVSEMYFHPDRVAKEIENAGLRAWVGVPILDFPVPGLKPDDAVEFARGFFERTRSSDLVVPTLCPHSTYTCGPGTLERVRGLRAELDDGTPHRTPLVHTHAAETRSEVYDVEARTGRRPVAQLDHHGLLDSRSVLAHCGWITKDEARRIGAAGAAVAHCPVSNLKLATGGTMPLPELDAAGAAVALGTDGAASNNTLDLFESMKFAALVHKQHRWDAAVAPAQRVLDMATLGGARALGAADRIGSLEAGKRGDLVLVDFGAPHLAPLHNVVSQLVYAARAGDVRATVVEGRVLFDRGEYRTLDAARVMREASAAAKRFTGSHAREASSRAGTW